jgi:diadenylate cyclase
MNAFLEIIDAYWKAGFEILILAAVIYYFLLLFRGTRGAAVFTGFIIVLLAMAALTQWFHLDVINWIMGRILAFLALAVLVIFQPELRRALAQLGTRNLFTTSRQRVELIDVIVETARSLSQKHHGGLMAIEREIGFRGVSETGAPIDAKATTELLTTIFAPNTPLHDGGVILRGDRIVAAACVFPLTQRQGLRASVGMRHRAALGLSEETDAVLVVVSEETGEISVAQQGNLVQGLDADGLREYLNMTLAVGVHKGVGITDWLRRLLSGMLREETIKDTGEVKETNETEDAADSDNDSQETGT